MSIIDDFKQCNSCKDSFPPTKRYFYSDKDKHDGLSTRCKTCINAAQKLRRELNPDQVKVIRKREYEKNRPKYLDRAKRYREADPDRHYLKNKEYNAANPEKVTAWKAKYRRNNRKTLNAKGRIYHFEHRDYERGYQQDWRKRNPDKRRARDHNRRALEMGAVGTYTSEDVALLMKSQRGLCWWCGCKITGNKYEIDHRIALVKGGSNNPNNLCISCRHCNRSKGSKMPYEWNGRLL